MVGLAKARPNKLYCFLISHFIIDGHGLSNKAHVYLAYQDGVLQYKRVCNVGSKAFKTRPVYSVKLRSLKTKFYQ